MANRKIGKSENPKFRTLNIGKFGKSEIRNTGNSENRKIGKFDIRKIGNSENRKIRKIGNSDIRKSGIWNIGMSENTSLARAVASLARTGNTCKYFETLKSGSPEIQYFGSLVNRKFGNSKHRKIGGSEKRKFRK